MAFFVNMTASDAITHLKQVEAPVIITDAGLETVSNNNGFKRVRLFPYTDSIGSLVEAAPVHREIDYWRAKMNGF